MPTLLEHLSSPPVFSGVRVTWSLVLYVCFVDCLSFCTFSFGHYVVCSSSIYRFWLPLWHLQTLLILMFPPSYHKLKHTFSKMDKSCLKNMPITFVPFIPLHICTSLPWIECCMMEMDTLSSPGENDHLLFHHRLTKCVVQEDQVHCSLCINSYLSDLLKIQL
jgi:hypothetical protein